MGRLCTQANVPSFGYHAIRHLSAKTAKMAGMETRSIGKLLGHQRESTTEIYLESLDPELDALADALESAEKKQSVQTGVQTEVENG